MKCSVWAIDPWLPVSVPRALNLALGALLDCFTNSGGPMRKKSLLFFLPLMLTILGTAPSNTNHFDGKSWWEHVKVLADDKMEGRETGSEGLRKAEAYVVEQAKKD